MDCLKNIVVGVDFSDFSRSALSQAVRMAGWNQAQLHALHIVDTSMVNHLKEFWGCKRALLGSQGAVEKIRDSALTQLKELVVGSEPQDGSVDVDTMTGTPFLELLRRVNRTSADLLVLGSNGSSDPSKGAGTLATKCVRKAATKVLLVRAMHAERFKKVVACVDFSESSHRVVEQAIRVAQQDSASLHLLHVFSAPWKGSNYVPKPSTEDQQQHSDSLSERMQLALQPFESEIRALQVETNVVENARESDGIVKFIGDSAADLVVVGTRGRTGMRAVLLGTVAERIVRESPCSVLAVKPDDFKYDID
ncbi:MAG: universal stress protein [Phycisphaerae bacterium]